ncbi:MAG: hypothetical protein GXN92_03020, partial [Candidatus Micrarchaeota archaeon]|nr:hypothetical protein [Candidatus Micrarchaeota archaeon]
MRWKELLIGLISLGFILMLIGFTVPSTSSSLTTYIYLDGAFVLKDQPFYLDINTYPDLLVGRFTLNKNTLLGKKAAFIWNEKELQGTIVRVEGSILYINVSGLIYRVPLADAALEQLETEIEVIPQDIVGVGVKSLSWRGDTILYYGDPATLDIGVTITNNGDWEYVGPFYLVASSLPRERKYYPLYEIMPLAVEEKAAFSPYEEEKSLSSKLVYKINNIQL